MGGLVAVRMGEGAADREWDGGWGKGWGSFPYWTLHWHPLIHAYSLLYPQPISPQYFWSLLLHPTSHHYQLLLWLLAYPIPLPLTNSLPLQATTSQHPDIIPNFPHWYLTPSSTLPIPTPNFNSSQPLTNHTVPHLKSAQHFQCIPSKPTITFFPPHLCPHPQHHQS